MFHLSLYRFVGAGLSLVTLVAAPASTAMAGTPPFSGYQAKAAQHLNPLQFAGVAQLQSEAKALAAANPREAPGPAHGAAFQHVTPSPGNLAMQARMDAYAHLERMR